MTDDRFIPVEPRDDKEIWDLVAALPVPAAAEDFLPRLRDRIAEQPVPAARPGARARVRGSSQRRLFLGIAAAAVAALICALVVLPALRGTPTATAADMLASMNAASGAQTIRLHIVRGIFKGAAGTPRGTVFLQPMSPVNSTSIVTLDASGDYAVTQGSWGPSTAAGWSAATWTYDEARHELRTDSNAADGINSYRPAWATDFPSIDPAYMFYEAAASSVRALLAEAGSKTPVSQITYLGRPAWRASLPEAWLGSGGGSLIATVDKATGLLLATDSPSQGPGGKTLDDGLRVTAFEADPTLRSGWQLERLPEATTTRMRWIYVTDGGTRFGAPDEVAARSWPTLPLVPQWAPDGYRLADSANAVWDDSSSVGAAQDHWVQATLRRPGLRPGVSVSRLTGLADHGQMVLLLFRRGFDSFVVRISPRMKGETSIGSSKIADPTAQDVTLTGGYLKGTRARTWTSLADQSHLNYGTVTVPRVAEGPTLLTYDDRSRITITGDLTRQELIAVANSLKVYGDVSRPLPVGYGH